MITTLLVANRGEIARRIFRTCREMGVRTVAVYVDADAGAPFVAEADEAVRLATGYLDGPAVVAAARAAGADAVHPGYGFLSENAPFARAVVAAGLVWVGPPPAVIEAMGDKLAAKGAAADAGVPTLASTDDVAAAGTVGYPLMVKAVAGGGGKGMRMVAGPEELDEAVAAARREAAGGFGDDRVFVERHVARARHVEVQVLGDAHGHVIHLGERECSIQRRHQKVVEESPAPGLDPATRAALGRAAVRLASALGYQSAGTVEFLLDADTGAFSFLEVNTRLQVEHPVTEAVTGLDLVRAQLEIAAGAPLAWTQDDVAPAGHAIEARLYAEDVPAGFLPATGTLRAWEPPTGAGVRWDSGVEAGAVVGLAFDPLLAKVIAHAPTRAEAAAKLAAALEGLHAGGVTTNRAFLVAVLRHGAFLAGDTTTDFVTRFAPDLLAGPGDRVGARPAGAGADAGDDADAGVGGGLDGGDAPVRGPEGAGPADPDGGTATGRGEDERTADRRRVATAAALWLQGRHRATAPVLGALPSGWRNARLPDQQVAFTVDGEAVAVAYRVERDGSFRVGGTGRARVHRWAEDGIDVEVDGRRRWYRVTGAGDRLHVQGRHGTVDLELVSRFPRPGAERVAGGLTAPMPGVVRDVRVGAGDAVGQGQVLVVLEAMKMEHHIVAPADGTVAEVRVTAGGQVGTGEVLLVLDEAGGEDR